MRPLDPRLLRYARSTRGFIALTVLLGAVTAGLVIVQARLLSDVIVSAGGGVAALAAVFAARAAVLWLGQVAAVRASARAKRDLRQAAMRQVLALGPLGPATSDPGGTAALLTRGVDALDSYFSRYLPQLVLAVIVPVAVLSTILGQDLVAALIVAVTVPLIPVFMVLIGLYTRSRVDRQWRALGVLSGHFLDLVAGLPTLKAFGRAKAQAAAIRTVGERYRSTTMGVLKISFLSALVLELLATLSVALVAVSVGLRLAQGQVTYSAALFVLILVPEAYLPLRLVGQHFHAAAEGLGAAERVFDILQAPLPGGGSTLLAPGPVTLSVEALTVRYPGHDRPALADVTFRATPGTVTAVVGGSGGGKSTLLAALLGFVPVESGHVVLRGGTDGAAVDLADVDLAQWRSRVAWTPQRAHLVSADLAASATVRQAVALRRPTAGDGEIWEALAQVGLADVVRGRDLGLDTALTADGAGLSVGQLQRLALARALLGAADVVLLDEPTAALDPRTEDVVVDAIGRLASRGSTVIVVAHRPALLDIADQVLRVEAPPEPNPEAGPAGDVRLVGSIR